MEAAILTGTSPVMDGTPPSLVAMLWDVYPFDYYEDLLIRTNVELTCAPHWRQCEWFYLGTSDYLELSIRDVSTPILTHSFGDNSATAIARMANQGCQPFTSNDGALTAWISVWSNDRPRP